MKIRIFPSVVSMSKDTRFLKAIHNNVSRIDDLVNVVSMSKDTRFLKAIHNSLCLGILYVSLFQ